MTQLVIQHRVKDYNVWKPVFDQHGATRKKHGATRHWLHRSVDDPNTLVIVIDFPSTQKAKDFANDPTLKEAMAKAGVESAPTLIFTETVETFDY